MGSGPASSGRWETWAALLLAATALSHIVFGYVGAASAIVCALAGPPDWLRQRLVCLLRIAFGALCLTAWFYVPLYLRLDEVNHSRWEPGFEWDSFGAEMVLRWRPRPKR